MVDAIRIVLHILILYLFYLIGVWIEKTFSLVIPGSMIGMLILFLLFATKIVNPKWMEKGANFLLRHMSVLFLPVMIGIINYLDFFKGEGLLLILIAFASTLIVLVSSGKMSEFIAAKREKEHG